jgi:enamine deaminase RidA (YjgF/YER057c/UK114 family)
VLTADRGSLASASVECAHLSGAELEEAAYCAFASALRGLDRAPMRVWSFLPRITEPDVDGMDRYMCMNRGRARAYRAASLPFIPAGTCTGHAGSDLVIHALAGKPGALPVENPRQRPAWSYTARFGPQPPPFTRGVIADRVLVASGTASVVGEETMHRDRPRRQWEETIRNLESLASAASARGLWRCMRVYVREPGQVDLFAGLARESFGDEVESLLVAPLCRKDLLVEVEGINHA